MASAASGNYLVHPTMNNFSCSYLKIFLNAMRGIKILKLRSQSGIVGCTTGKTNEFL